MNRTLAFFKRPLPVLITVASLVGACGFFDTASSQTRTNQNTVTVPAPKPPEKAEQDLKQAVPLDLTKMGEALPRNLFVELSKLINPTVVSITTTQSPRNRQAYRDPLQEFLEDFYGGGGGRGGGGGGGRARPQPRQQQPAQALGTGFIIRQDGLIITNNHVIAQADVIRVQLDNTSDTFYEAEVIGTDTLTDIALIKINAKKPLPYARLGSSKDVQVGEWVAAFGNPYGHAHTMTKGIVSAIGREIAEINRFPFIQTDASINPGNSGGPLVNTQGLVIGVNTAIDARAQGIGFAIPIDNVKQIVEVLEKDGRVRRGFLGVSIATVDEQLASQLGLQEPTGTIVAEVVRGGPADKAGVRPYDIIVDVNGKKITNPNDLTNTIASTPIGSKANIKIWRFSEAGKRSERTVSVNIQENPTDTKQARAPTKKYFGQKAPFDLGFKVSDHSASLAEEFGLPVDGPKGALVTEVESGSPASATGLQVGDMILDVNRQPTAKAADVLRSLKKGRNIVRLVRGNAVIIVTIGQ